MSKLSSVEDYKQIAIFQSLRTVLLDHQRGEHLDKPLAYWAVSGDRRLPLAFLGRPVHDLLNTPFEELCATPGVGRKKVGSLLELLKRASKEVSANSASHVQSKDSSDGKPRSEPTHRHSEEFNPNEVSESHWDQWRETVRQHGIGYEKLGRLAPTLQALPSVIWNTPLSTYLTNSVAELRRLKTHGEKRVNVILQVFHAVHEVLGSARLKSHLTLRLMPKFVLPVEQWINHCLEIQTKPSDEHVRQSLAIPLVEQINVDCGSTIARLAEGRLGVHGPRQSVKTQANRMGITRARVYQMLEECSRVMSVRWPEGLAPLLALRKKLGPPPTTAAQSQLFHQVVDLFFPDEEEYARRKNDKSDKSFA